MRYIHGILADVRAIRRAIDIAAGMPYYLENFPSPPGNPDPEAYEPGAVGWMEHVLEPVFDMGNGQGLLRAPDDVLPYVGQTVDVDGAPVTIPTEAQLLERTALPVDVQAWLYSYENPTPI